MGNLLAEFHQKVVNDFKESGPVFNWLGDVKIPAVDLGEISIIEFADEAKKWRASERAPDMYFSHGEYYGDGIHHIIDELKIKPTSNRALYSLLNQSDISGKGDDPIPSFLTFQCSIENKILYCTACFRALEVGRFLRINLEEIRQNLVEIYEKLQSFEVVHLNIFAFHAYLLDITSSALRRPKIDVMSKMEILLIVLKGRLEVLDALLEEFEQSTTVVSSESLKSILEAITLAGEEIHPKFRAREGLLLPRLHKAIAACQDLASSRKGASRGVNTSLKIRNFHLAVQQLRASLQGD